MSEMNYQEVTKLLEEPKNVVITSHRNPDGDAIGSSVSLVLILKKLKHKVTIVFPSEYPVDFEFLTPVKRAIIFDQTPEKALQAIEKAELFFALDYNALDRVDKMAETIRQNPCPKILIDHHLNPGDFAQFVLSDTSASSTCELMWIFFQQLGYDDLIDKKVAESLYTGINTDTGSFKYSTSPRLFQVCSKLLEKGADDVKIQGLIYDKMEEKKLRILGHCLANRMEIIPEFSTAIIHLTKRDYEKFDIQRGDTEGVVNYLLRIKGIKLAAFIARQPNITKLSLRSKGNFSVQKMAERYFNGGGHKNAAGGFSYKGLTLTLERFKSILPNYEHQLKP
ncbi:MAG: bifunctional oligoribonuclease/PAP phosphatase NrnA [Bacteroidia bacterium]|nr:bifunctional oligoribonuclease/PAP phosphatase NrnA [Bacteroidia bacterium]